MGMIVISGMFALLFIVSVLINLLHGRRETGFWDTLFVFTAAIAGVLALANADVNPLVSGGLRLIAIVLVVFGLLILSVDLLRRERNLSRSKGLLGFGGGLLLAVSLFVTPMLSGMVTLLPDFSTAPAQAVGMPNPGDSAAFAQGMPSNIAFGTMPDAPPTTEAVEIAAVPTTTPPPPRPILPTPTPTNTSFPLIRATPGASETADPEQNEQTAGNGTDSAATCQGVIINNLNLRAAPDAGSELLTTLPYNTIVTLTARNTDSTWWATTYNSQQGWLLAEYVELLNDCSTLPIWD